MKEKLWEGSFVVRTFVHVLNLDKHMTVKFLKTVAKNTRVTAIDRVDVVQSDLYPQPDVVIKGRDQSGQSFSAKILVEILPDYPLRLEQVSARKIDTDHVYLICDYEDDCNLTPQVETVLSWNQVFSFFVKEFHSLSSQGRVGVTDALHDLISVLCKLGIAAGEVQANVVPGLSSLWNLQLQINQALNILVQDETSRVQKVRPGEAAVWERWKWLIESDGWKVSLNLCLETGTIALCMTLDGGEKDVGKRLVPVTMNEMLGWRGWSLNEYYLSLFDFGDQFFTLPVTKQVDKLMHYIRSSLSLLPKSE